jgi:glycosyltransferase involved in cell wall biosynthesis
MRRKLLLVLPNSDRRGASARYRVYQYLPALERAGFTVETIAPMKSKRPVLRIVDRVREESRLLRAVPDADLVLVQKRLLSRHFVDRLRRVGKPIVFDLDDAIFTSPKGDWSTITRWRVRQRLRRVLRASALVLVGNDYLRAYVERDTSRAVVLPTAVEIARYPVKTDSSGNNVRLGWIGSRVNHRYLSLLTPVLRRLTEEIPWLRLVVVSDEDYAAEGVAVENRRWSEETEVQDLLTFDIGLMPLADDEWTRGKCALKALQYMAAGVPAVCSAVGANNDVIEHGADGFLCTSEGQWHETLARLARDPDLRRVVGCRGRETVERRYAAESIGTQVAALLDGLIRISQHDSGRFS